MLDKSGKSAHQGLVRKSIKRLVDGGSKVVGGEKRGGS